METSFKDFAEGMMQVYDLATELAPKEGKSHRETFNLICQLLELEWKIAEGEKRLEETDKHIHELNEQIKERLGTLAILSAIQQRKMGYG